MITSKIVPFTFSPLLVLWGTSRAKATETTILSSIVSALNTTKSRAPPQPILLHMTQASPGNPWAIASVKLAMINEVKWSTKWPKWASNHLPIIAQTLCHVLHRRTDKNWCKQLAVIDRQEWPYHDCG